MVTSLVCFFSWLVGIVSTQIYWVDCVCNFSTWQLEFLVCHLWIMLTTLLVCMVVKVKVAQLCLTLCDPMDCSPWNSLGQKTGMGSCSLLQGIFPMQGLNSGLLHCRQILYQLSHQGSPRILVWVTYLFSSKSSPPRNRTRVSCIAGRFLTNWTIREALGGRRVSDVIIGEQQTNPEFGTLGRNSWLSSTTSQKHEKKGERGV